MKVAVILPASIADAADYLANARALDAAGAQMIGVEGDPEQQWMVLAAIAAVTTRVRLRAPSEERIDLLDRLSRGRALANVPAGERWVPIALPADRASWAAALHDQEQAGATGVVVPWDERLIDLLRNPEPEDRSDLLMSTG
jgi:alkanesulfonate monooxygenase SsuD/methylene tetrahydromethanopterin reductase-like flavin-dependent oxidoreductase (luciferase family)